ncbi:MAG: GDP-mannose 4,6-dehydratase [Dehalococcoidia bacterium]|nr:GDP-mannose 4,6-dehydratase [Dehalococcoidia bacterium]
MILITGGLGFLGSSLAETLMDKGHRLLLTGRSATKARNLAAVKERAAIEHGDVTDFDWVRSLVLEHSPEVIFHFAGQLTSYESFENPLYDVDVNSKSTLSILEAMRELKKPCRFILGSTFWVTGRPESLPVNEETPCWPLNIYAADRLASEHYCHIYHNVYNMDTVVMRLTNTFGSREQYNNPKKAALNNLIYRAYKREPVPIYNQGKFFRDYLYVSDAVTAAEAVMEKGRPGQCYFIGTGVTTWFYDIGRWLAELTGTQISYVEAPDYHRRIDMGNIVVDNQRLRGLGWEWKIPVKEGIKRTLDYYREIEA